MSTASDNPYERGGQDQTNKGRVQEEEEIHKLDGDACAPRKHSLRYMASESNLLRTDLVSYHDGGWDNPFKPDTELSWEADIMVRLMKRGYPISELNNLVEAAKSYKLDHSRIKAEQAQPHMRRRAESVKIPGQQQLSHKERLLGSSDGIRDPTDVRNMNLNEVRTVKRQSSLNQLDNKKSKSRQVWADSLKRTKSMTKFTSQSCDADSLDKLIISIENEISSLLNETEDKRKQKNGEKSSRGKNSKSVYSNSPGDRGVNRGKEPKIDNSDIRWSISKSNDNSAPGHVKKSRSIAKEQSGGRRRDKSECCVIH